MVAIKALERAFSLGYHHTEVTADAVITAAAAAAFAEQEVCYFRQVVDPVLLQMILEVARTAEVDPEPVVGLGERRKEKDDLIGAAVRSALVNPALRQWMQRVAGCDPLVRVTGRLVETHAGTGQGLIWHDDLVDRHRRLAVVINFSNSPYLGGEFEMRRMCEPYDHFSFVHEEIGSAMIFKINDHLMHRVLPVTAGGPRRVFAGWLEADTLLPELEA